MYKVVQNINAKKKRLFSNIPSLTKERLFKLISKRFLDGAMEVEERREIRTCHHNPSPTINIFVTAKGTDLAF